MNSVTEQQHESLPDHLLEQAAIWCARMHDEHADQYQASFHVWLAEDKRHQAAYDEMQQLWQRLEQPVQQILASDSVGVKTPPQRFWPMGFSRFSSLAMAASVLLIGLTSVFYASDFQHYWLSDYDTSVGETRQLALQDGSQVTLNSDSALAIDFDEHARKTRLLRGEAWFEVASQPARPFTVETPNGEVKVTGTKFNVRVSDQQTWVSLAEGQVKLSQNQQQRLLAPGEQTAMTSTTILPTHSFDVSTELAWLRGQFVFYETPLQTVIDRLSQYRTGRVMLLDEELKQMKVSGIFHTDQPENVLQIITDTLPVKMTKITDYLVLLHLSAN